MNMRKLTLPASLIVLASLLAVVTLVLSRSQNQESLPAPDGKHWERLVPSQSKSSASDTKLGDDSLSQGQPTPESPKWQSVSEVQVLGKIIRVGDSADDVFATLTKDYGVADPTVVRIGQGMIVTQHYFVQGSYIDITFERPGNWYVATSIRVKER